MKRLQFIATFFLLLTGAGYVIVLACPQVLAFVAGVGIQINGTTIGTKNVPTGFINVVTDEGAKCDTLVKTHGAMDNNSTAVLTDTTDHPFAATDCQSGAGCTGTVNKKITVDGAGAAGVAKSFSITGFTDASHVTLSANNTSGSAISSKTFYFGTNDTTAITNAAIAACPIGGCIAPVFFPPGMCYTTGLVFNTSTLGTDPTGAVTGLTMIGSGSSSSTVPYGPNASTTALTSSLTTIFIDDLAGSTGIDLYGNQALRVEGITFVDAVTAAGPTALVGVGKLTGNLGGTKMAFDHDYFQQHAGANTFAFATLGGENLSFRDSPIIAFGVGNALGIIGANSFGITGTGVTLEGSSVSMSAVDIDGSSGFLETNGGGSAATAVYFDIGTGRIHDIWIHGGVFVNSLGQHDIIMSDGNTTATACTLQNILFEGNVDDTHASPANQIFKTGCTVQGAHFQVVGLAGGTAFAFQFFNPFQVGSISYTAISGGGNDITGTDFTGSITQVNDNGGGNTVTNVLVNGHL